MRPTDVNGINKAAGEYYHLVYNNVFGVRACSLRLTNVYGPRQLLQHNRQGFIGWFIRLAIEDQEIQIFGDGSQLRDFVYVDDAVDAFLRAGAERCVQRRGVQRRRRSSRSAHRDLVDAADSIAGGRALHAASTWPPDKKAIDIGDFYADSSKIARHSAGSPTTPLARRARGARSSSTARTSITTFPRPETAGREPVTPDRIPFHRSAPGRG